MLCEEFLSRVENAVGGHLSSTRGQPVVTRHQHFTANGTDSGRRT